MRAIYNEGAMSAHRQDKSRSIREAAATYRATPKTPAVRVPSAAARAKRQRALELAVDLMIDVYGPALRELEKH